MQMRMILAIVGCFLVFQYQFATHQMALGEMMDEQDELYVRLIEVSTQTAAMVKPKPHQLLTMELSTW
jgi:hypothetical protein